MKLDIKALHKKALQLLKMVSVYSKFIITLVFLLIYVFLAFQIKNNIQKSPDDDTITERLSKAGLPKIDQNSIDRINKLKDQDLHVKALFKKARSNPFNE